MVRINTMNKGWIINKGCLILFLTVLTAAQEKIVFASEGTAATPMHWFWAVINFLILFTTIGLLIRKPIKTYLNQRSRMIEDSIMQARQAKELAEKALEAVQAQLKQKDAEIEKILLSSKKYGESERERLINEARSLSNKLKELTERNIAYELKKAKDELKKEIADTLIELSAKRIQETMREEDENKLIEDSIRMLGKKN
ncbi:ATPase, F0 complex, subunit B/B', bacterial and chloroplast [Candidatus Magnetoovum chiemensis]|nr:ATPase, F0 complex, subunit B/B', bacterial and chloroplast [Candidatus Magnetoovum chiemensis]